MSKRTGWIGVDLDGTLANYREWKGIEHVGPPIPAMVERVKQWLAEGIEVRIMTARVAYLPASREYRVRRVIERWCEQHIGQTLAITCCKDMDMIEQWDDRAVQVVPNTGVRVDGD